jgi:hypothetical protein
VNDLRYLYSGSDTREEQPIEPGQAADYVAVFVVRGANSWIAVELVRRHLRFGRIERWAPTFSCVVPPELQAAIVAAAPTERYFQFWFRGTPTEKGRFGRDGQCIREVCIHHVTRIIEGSVPPIER